MKRTVELGVLSVKLKSIYGRPVGSAGIVILRADRLRAAAPGEIVVVKPIKQWIYGGTPTLTGTIESTRLDIPALGLVPLRLEPRGTWDPAEHYWGDRGEPIEPWAKPLIALGKRPQFEMEQVLPGYDPEDPDSDPIGQSNDLREAYEDERAYQILMDCCRADLRCLDAHAHLGNFRFDWRPQAAIRHYEAGYRIGKLSLGDDFDGVLPWGHIDNRPFLRCMHGYALCLWRLRKFGEASRVFERMLWLNPSDNQGVRLVIGEVRAKGTWRPDGDG